MDRSFALDTAIATVARLFKMEAESDGQLKVVRTITELRASLDIGVLAAVLHFEGAEMIDPRLNALEVFYEAGLRSLGPAWSRPNPFCQGVPLVFPGTPDTGPGLTETGKALVRRCNELGVMIDLSHLNERGFWDVAAISTAPLIATHSNAHALCASPRNLLDAQLGAIKDSDGVVGVSFAVALTRADGRRDSDTPLEVIARHFDYLCERLGPDHVAFGSDFDGTKIPAEMGDATGLPKFLQMLRDRGYGESDLRKLAHENWLRVLGATWTNN